MHPRTKTPGLLSMQSFQIGGRYLCSKLGQSSVPISCQQYHSVPALDGQRSYRQKTLRAPQRRLSDLHQGKPATSSAMSKQRIEPGPGQESVWDYPRPPACESTDDHVQVYLNDKILADTKSSYRVLETSHPPVYYIPQKDVEMDLLQKAQGGSTFCEWKGSATYFSAGKGRENIAWAYEQPSQRFAAIKDYLAFYPSKVQKALVNGEQVQAQQGDFYGGWITGKIVGPFKGGMGTWGW